ncbi:MAG TPA: hypothetical protein VH475_17095 [Tepidisphaeraceae bacterium]
MKGPLRILLYAMTATMILVVVAAAGLWLWSAWGTVPPLWDRPQGAVARRITVEGAALVVHSEWARRPMALNANTRAMLVPLSRQDAWGFSRARSSWVPETTAGVRLPGSFGTIQETRVSLVWPMLIAGFGAAWLLRQVSRRARPAPTGICRQCGYDLRATPERCPECGTIAKA